MKRWIVWLLCALLAVLIAWSVGRALASRKAQQSAQVAAATAPARAPLVLMADEVVRVQRQTVNLGVPVAGAVRALNTAVIKARTSGELQGLSLREGDRVKAGQEVARIDPTETRARWRQAQEQADASRAQVDINQRQFDNNRALVDKGFISATALASSQSSLQAAQASYRAAQAAADAVRKTLDDTVLRSPLSGLVAQRLAQPGERVSVDTRVLEVVNLAAMELEALLSPQDATAVRVGQSAQIQLPGTAEVLSATVARINPSAQAGSRNVPVYLLIAQSDTAPVLRQGMYVQGTLTTGQIDALVLPLDAVRTDRPTPYVQTVHEGQVAYVPVTTGPRSGVQGQTLVAVQGVPEGTVVIGGRVGLLGEKTAVTVTASAASAEPATSPAPSTSAAPAQ